MIKIGSSARQAAHKADQGQRGYAVSVLLLGVFAALIMVAGLVIDGGQKASAVSRAETVAAGAARAAVNGGIGDTVTAGDHGLSTGQARAAAENYLTAAAVTEQLTGSVIVVGDRVTVHTEVTVDTIFLSVIGIDHLRASGDASARILAQR